MSALPTDIGQSLERLRSRRQYVDSLIAENRRNTPAEATNQRQVDRLSIAELSDLNADQIARRLSSMRFDNRSTVEKVIDLIDLPRNQIFNLVAPGIARKQAMKGEFGAAGTPEVTGSDVLRELGVDNSVLRGTLGFVTDVAFDPLTYVGGGAVKTTLRAGQAGRRSVLEFGRTGSRALKGGIKAAARGEEVADRTVRNLVETAGFSRERLARLREAGFTTEGVETLIRRRLMGRETPRLLQNRRLAKQNPRLARDAAARRQAFDRPGLIGRRFLTGSTDTATRQGRQAQAAREFVAEHGVAARPGVRIGGDRAVQQVAHIPFTDVGVMVPAFSRAGRRASAVRAIAGAAQGSVAGRAVLRGQEIADELARLADDSARLGSSVAPDVARLDDEARMAVERADPLAYQRRYDADVAHQAMIDDLEDIRARSEALAQEARALTADASAASIGDTLALARVREEALASARLATERLRRLQDTGIDATRLSEGVRRTERIAGVVERLQDIGRSSRGAMLPIDDAGRAVISANPNAVARAVEMVRPLLLDLDDATAEIKALQETARDAKGAPGPLFSRAGLESADRKLAEAQARAQRIRDDIHDATAALREGPLAPVDDVYEQVRRADAARLGSRIERWVDAPPGAQEAVLREVDSLQASIEAAQKVADLADASITRYLDTAERDMVDAIKTALGTNDDVIGSAGLVDFARLVTFPLAEDNVVVRGAQAMDRWMAQKFGRRGNMGHEWARFLQRSYREDAQRAFSQSAGSIARAVRETLERHNIPADRMDEALEMATLLLYKRQSSGGRLYNDVWVDGVGPVTVREALERYPDKVGDNWVVALHRATTEGMLQDAALRADLEKIADDTGLLFEDLGKLAEDDAMIRAIDGYVPGVLTPEARTAVGASGRNFGQEAASNPLTGKEFFEKPRATMQYRFQRADGSWVRFFEGDRRYLDLPPAELSDEQRNLVEIITEYDTLQQPPPGLPTDVFELNDLVGRGKFASITGGAGLNRGFFESNLAALTAHRTGSHLRAMAKRASQDWINTQGVSVDTQILREAFQSPGSPVQIADGRRAVTINPVRGQAAVKIGGQVYRKLNREIVRADNAIGQAIGNAADTRMFPEQIADQIERVAQTVAPESDVWRAYDQILGAWKSSTLLHASWPATEILGNSILAAVGGARLDRMARNAPGVMRAVFWERTPNIAGKAAVTINGRTLTGEELVAGAQALGVTDSSAATELAAMMSANNFIKMPSQGNPLRSARQAATDAAERMLGRAQPAGASASDHPFHQHPMRRLIAPFFRLNQKSNDSMRILAWLSHMEDGMDAASAAARVRETMFDFGDLTPFESRYMRRMLPFYCVPDTAECLTRDGWKTVDELTIGEEALTYNKDIDRMEWKPVEDIATFDFDGELENLRLPSGKFDVVCTDDHRWAVERTLNFVKGKWYGGERKIVRCHDLNTGHKIIVAAPLLEERDSALTPEQSTLLGWLLTDGYWRHRGNHIEAVIYQSPRKFLEEVKEVAGGKPRAPHPETGVVCVPVLKERLEPLRKWLTTKDEAWKVVPHLSLEAADAMREAMYRGDGTLNYDSRFLACMNPGVREAYRMLALLCGRKTTVSDRGLYESRACRTIKVNSLERKRVPYKGRIWCPKTSNGTWVMRQGESITITGNTWIRNNMAYQAQLVLKRPAIAANYPRAVEAIEQVIAGDAEVPDSMRPRWMRDQLALQIGRDPEKNWSVLTRTAVPVGDAYEALAPLAMDQGAMQDFLQLFVGGVSPLIKAPFELASGREIFTGREIGGTGFGDLSQQQYLLQQVRWLREFGVGEPGLGALGRASESGVGGVAGRLLLGGRSQPFTNESLGSQSLREMKDMERQARIAIRRAESAGDQAALQRSLANLMNIYRRMQSTGFEAEIPKYARDLLEAVAAGGLTDGGE